MVQVRVIKPSGIVLSKGSGPAGAMHRLGQIQVVSSLKALGTYSLLVQDEGSGYNGFVNLNAPQDISMADAARLQPDMPVFYREDRHFLRSDGAPCSFYNMGNAVEGLQAVVDEGGRLLLARRRGASVGASGPGQMS